MGGIRLNINTKVIVTLIFCMVLPGLFVVPVCANDENAWFSPAPLEAVLGWMKTTPGQAWASSPGYPGTENQVLPSELPSGEDSWFIPASPDDIILWGKRVSKETSGIAFSSGMSQEDRIRLLRSFNSSTPAIVTPEDTLPVPTMVPLPPSGKRFTSQKPVSAPVTTYNMASPSVTLAPSQAATSGSRFTTQIPVTVPDTPYYLPSTPVTPVVTVSPVTGGGVSLTELNLPGRYVKITNPGTSPVIMTGWKVTNSRGNSLNFIDFPLGDGRTFTYVLYPYSTVTIYFGKEGIITGNELYYPPGTDFWDPGGDTASLYDPDGRLAGRISV